MRRGTAKMAMEPPPPPVAPDGASFEALLSQLRLQHLRELEEARAVALREGARAPSPQADGGGPETEDFGQTGKEEHAHRVRACFKMAIVDTLSEIEKLCLGPLGFVGLALCSLAQPRLLSID